MIVKIDYTPRPFLIVGMKEKARRVFIGGFSGRLGYWTDKKEKPVMIPLPPGEYSSPILVSEITEKQLEGLIDDCPWYAKRWKDYRANGTAAKSCSNRIASLRSILEKERLYYKNPFGLHEPEMPDELKCETFLADACNVRYPCCKSETRHKIKNWKEAQPRVFSDFAIVPLKV